MEHHYQHQAYAPQQPQSPQQPQYTPSYNPTHEPVQTVAQHPVYPVQTVAQPPVYLVQNSAQRSPLKEKEECCCGCDPKHGLIIFGVLYLLGGLYAGYTVLSLVSIGEVPLLLWVCVVGRILFGVLALAGVDAKNTSLVKACLVVCSIITVVDAFWWIQLQQPYSMVVEILFAIWIITMGLSFMRNLENECD